MQVDETVMNIFSFSGILNGSIGSKPEDFYFKCNKKGGKMFYSKISGNRVSKCDIPETIIDKIQPRDSDLDTENLLRLKKSYTDEITKLQAKVAEIDAKLKGKPIDEKELQRKRYEEEINIKRRKEEIKREREELLRKLFGEFEKDKNKHKDKTTPPAKDKTLLEQHGIINRSDWKKWLVKNHPDKGGNEELCKKIISAGRAEGW